MNRSLLLLICAAIGLGALPSSAQDAGFTIRVEPYEVPEKIPIVLRNDGPDPITLDSLAFDLNPAFEQYDAYGWSVEIIGYRGDEVLTSYVFCVSRALVPKGSCESLTGQPIEGPYATGDSLALVLGLTCDICRSASSAPPFPDSLQVFSGGRADPQRVGFFFDYPVAAEDSPGAESLRAGPNPARHHVTLELAKWADRTRQLVVTNSRGREILRSENADGSSWRLDVSGWAPGVYYARASNLPESVAFTVVR